MTRFARAKGSKSSNEKVPEEGTPWSEMKKGVLMKQEKELEKAKHVASLKRQADRVKPLEWFSFNDENEDSLTILKNHLEKGNIKKLSQNTSDVKKENKKTVMPGVEVSSKQKKRRKTSKNLNNVNKRLTNLENESKQMEIVTSITEDRAESAALKKQKRKNKKVEGECEIFKSPVSKKKKIAKTETLNAVLSERDGAKNIKKKRKKKLKKKKECENDRNKQEIFASAANQNCPTEKKFKYDGNKFTTKINVGGEMVTLVKFQGYYVTKNDAKMLKEMKRRMIEEGIPESQIETVIKLERRKCEKSLARMKKNVCFQCRKPGHILSQCPEMQNSVETGTGVCYKCGSTEHKAFTCKVTHGQKFPFAECFICKEKGHIARECPDNPRGLYPKGGCCKLCGDVTHLKKDCPTKISEAEEKTIKVGLRDDMNLEGLEEVSQNQETDSRKRPQKKLVQF